MKFRNPLHGEELSPLMVALVIIGAPVLQALPRLLPVVTNTKSAEARPMLE